MAEKANPYRWLLEHRSIVLGLVGKDYREAWKELCRAWPEVKGMMSENTFKNYRSVISEGERFYMDLMSKLSEENAKLRQDVGDRSGEWERAVEANRELEGELAKLREENQRLDGELSKLRREATIVSDSFMRVLAERDSLQKEVSKLREEKPKESVGAQNIAGWTVRFDGRYYRLYKSIGGKVHTIHVGKELDEKKAWEKIREKMREIEGRKSARSKPSEDV